MSGPGQLLTCASRWCRLNFSPGFRIKDATIESLHCGPRALETEVSAELKNRHYLDISKAREQILYIAQNAGLSTDDLLIR
jgi:hypothetical protein